MNNEIRSSPSRARNGREKEIKGMILHKGVQNHAAQQGD